MATVESLDVLARVGIAAALGAVLGLERETDGHEAGLRTHALLALGAALSGHGRLPSRLPLELARENGVLEARLERA